MRLRSIVIHPPATTRVLRGLLRATGPMGEPSPVLDEVLAEPS